MDSNVRSTSRSRLRQRLARVFRSPSLLHFSCNPSSSAATNLSSAGSRRALLCDVVHEPVLVPRRLVQDYHDDNTLGRRSSSLPTTEDRRRRPPTTPATVRRSFDCSGCRHFALELSQPLFSKDRKKKTKKGARAIETGDGGECIRTCPPVPPSSPWKNSYYNIYCSNKNNEDGHTKKKLSTNANGFTSSSSIESDHELGFFSAEEEEEEEEEEETKEEGTETFFSSRSLSSISSAFHRRHSSIKNKMKINKKDKKKSNQYYEGWGRCQGFQPLLSNGSSKDQKETSKSGYAVTKRSMDPYGDFRRSMAEMIIERQIFGAGDLEGLLQSYILLNSPGHHSIIIEAFSDICLSLFGN